MAKYFDYKEFEKSYLEQKNKGEFFFNDPKELEQKKDLTFKEFNENFNKENRYSQNEMDKAIDEVKTDYQNKFKEYQNNVLSNVLLYLKEEMSLDELTDFLKGEILDEIQ